MGGYTPLYGRGSAPRTMPYYSYEPADPDRSAAGHGTMLNYQSSSSERGRVTNTDYQCIKVYTDWECGCQTVKVHRYRNCWKCNDLDHGLCHPEENEIDEDGDCRKCREEKRAKAQAEKRRGEARKRDRHRERSPAKSSSHHRSRSY